MQYYFSNDGNNQQGPLDLDGLRNAGITRQTLVWREGMPAWTAAGEVAELASIFNVEPNPSYPPIDDRSVPLEPQAYQSPVAPPPPQVGQPLQYQGPQQYAHQYHNPGPNGMAVASLVLGIIAIPTVFCNCIGLLPAILAIIFGHIAQSQIRKGNGSGGGMALAGLIMGYLVIVLSIVMIIFFFALGIYGSTTTPTFTPAMPTPTRVPAPQIPQIPRPPTNIPTFPKPPTIPTH